MLKPKRDGAVELLRPLRPEALNRERRKEGRDRVVYSLHRSERSVDVRGSRSDVSEETRRVSLRIPQRVPEHCVISFTLQETCNDGSDVAPCVVDSPSDVVHAFSRGDPA